MIKLAEPITSAFTNGSSIQLFVESTLKQIEAGKPQNYKVSGDISFDLSIIQTAEAGGKIDLKVVGIGGEVTKEQTQRITFALKPINEAEEAETKARIARAKAQEEFALKAPFNSLNQKY